MLRKVFGPKKGGLKGGGRNWHNEELIDLPSLPNMISQMHVYSVISRTHKLLVNVVLANSFGSTIEVAQSRETKMAGNVARI
jgi:hypothetical protein